MLEVDPPLTKSGNGSVPSPWRLGVDTDDLMSDVAGLGLTWDKGLGKLQACLSTDSGNSLRFGADGCLYAPGGDSSMPEVCARPIESLPAAPGVVGAEALAGLHGPYSSPHQLEYCLGHGFDLIGFKVATSSDDVGVVVDYWNHRLSAGRSSIYVSQDVRQVSSSTVKSLINYAGDADDPVSYDPGESFPIADRTDRKGGWWGWLAARYQQPLAGEFLARIDGKAVALMDCSPHPEAAAYPESDAITGAIRAVLQHCAQPWAMIGVRELTNAETVSAAGITPVMMPLRPETWGETGLPYPVDDLTGAGVEWIVLSHLYDDEVFTTYRDAGLQVLMWGDSRHATRARIESLELRGGYMLDPLYYRGGIPGGNRYGYRAEYDPWEHRRPGTGQLTYRTDQGNVVSPTGQVRGRVEAAEQGLILPSGFGEDLGRAAVLCGWEAPLTDAESYTITWDMKWNTLASVAARAKMGLLFGAATDADPREWPEDAQANPSGFPEGQKTLYRVYQRQNGEIGIGKWASQDSDIVSLATANSPAIAANAYNTYELVVSPTQITFTRVMANGQRVTVTTGDQQYRGGYFWIEKEESFFGSTANRFEGKFRNITYAPASGGDAA
ncbi:MULTISPECIES: hypothetical protein [Streptomycetaceae]|uniref:hypothetical protein n=2 Tax=Kitasatosporales TaxID=85011 RepID=UPI00037D1F34|nr:MULTISPECIES: hypothetical protein [Streptomycetaceae]